MDSEIRRTSPADVDACVRICRELPEFFSADVPDELRADLERHAAWVLVDASDVVAYVVVDRRTSRAVEILWAAVTPSRQNAGLGSALLAAVFHELADDGVRLVEVKTLDQAAGYQPYVATRAFWERRGFVQIDTIDPLPGWRSGNPAAIYVAALARTTAHD